VAALARALATRPSVVDTIAPDFATGWIGSMAARKGLLLASAGVTSVAAG
jgi:hypothetical protein